MAGVVVGLLFSIRLLQTKVADNLWAVLAALLFLFATTAPLFLLVKLTKRSHIMFLKWFYIPWSIVALVLGVVYGLFNAAPSVQPHYRAFIPTTSCSAPVPRLYPGPSGPA
jgi:hypothetical protein